MTRTEGGPLVVIDLSNRLRDADTDRHLAELGWVSMRFREHENRLEVADSV